MATLRSCTVQQQQRRRRLAWALARNALIFMPLALIVWLAAAAYHPHSSLTARFHIVAAAGSSTGSRPANSDPTGPCQPATTSALTIPAVLPGSTSELVPAAVASSNGAMPAVPPPPSVALISWHQGTINEFRAVAEQAGFDLTVSWPIRGYNPSREGALEAWTSVGELYCKHYDAIVVMDTVPAGGRPLLEAFTWQGPPDGTGTRVEAGAQQAQLAQQACRARRIVMLMTNRFDFGVGDDPAFYLAVQRSLVVDGIVWAQNNPYEEWHMRQMGINITGPLPLLRPQGQLPRSFTYTDAAQHPAPNPALPVVVAGGGDQTILLRQLRAYNISFVEVQHRKYGGAQVLAEYKCLIHLPYQVSTMAFYENVAAGVVYLVPSPRLMASLVASRALWFPGGTGDTLYGARPDFPWSSVEWYHPFFRGAVLSFDSWQELGDRLATADFAAARREAVARMDAHRADVLAAWKRVLDL